MLTNERILKNMTVGEILDYTIEVYKRNFKKLTLLALIFYIPFTFIIKIFTSYLYADFSNILDINTVANPENIVYSVLAYYASFIVIGFVNLVYGITLKAVMDAALIEVVYKDVTGKSQVGLKSIVKSAFKRFTGLMVYKILYGLIIFGVAAASCIVLYIVLLITVLGILSGYSTSYPANVVPGTATAVLLIVFIILVILGIVLLAAYIAVKFMFGVQAIVIERKTAVESFSRSSALTKKSFWHIAVAYLLGSLLFFIIPQLLAAGAYYLMFVNRTVYMVGSVLSQIISSLFYPFIITLSTMLFINLKIRKEGFDLELKVDFLIEKQKAEEKYSEGGETVNAR